MTKVDQFESMFRAAHHEVYRPQRVAIASVLVVTDLDEPAARSFGDEVRAFLGVLGGTAPPTWRDVAGAEYRTAGDLLKLVESASPDLICTYRNLHSTAWRWPYSLGVHVDLLTQHTRVPVMVLPHPEADRSAKHAMKGTPTVMAITDHLAGDARGWCTSACGSPSRAGRSGSPTWKTRSRSIGSWTRSRRSIRSTRMVRARRCRGNC